MSVIEPEDQFTSEDELRKLLERWETPHPSRSLDKRVANTYAREIASANLQADSALLSQKQKEVGAMKFCSTCQEEFAERFSFCPVDGTPLSAAVVKPEQPARLEDSSVTREHDHSSTGDSQPAFIPQVSNAGGGSKRGAPRSEFHLTMMDDSGLVQRLGHELSDVTH